MQRLKFYVWVIFIFRQPHQIVGGHAVKVRQRCNRKRADAVSYTHLDVYKRQAEQISYAVASGGQIWGYQAIQSEVLYLGLEDTVTRLQLSLIHILSSSTCDMIRCCFLLKVSTI